MLPWEKLERVVVAPGVHVVRFLDSMPEKIRGAATVAAAAATRIASRRPLL